MVRGKHKTREKHWHHRVPDFKLVYCGPKEGTSKETIRLQRGKVEEYVTDTGNDELVNKLDKKRNLEKRFS